MQLSRNQARQIKHARIRRNLSGTKAVPRISVFKSLTNFYAQAIDDEHGVTLASSNTAKNKTYGGNIAAASALGSEFGKLLITKKIKKVVFDRSGYIYHGRVKAFADAVRKEGVKF
ncbi:50S ribosomal protein L18 [Mycoplasmopsis californica]|uniref:Large ribosomal subunit protein uL18 n=1 Tax=Mycoplasmopsis equigenitalium TaxID=114883 RepID=A0ABY5J2U7_9BACT|nr:50S ribosomal protein L18 [Mycoplasmopsis equigenitalium]UUD37098.1 50S ribosomal protein L18 [Mycoplasmopsis equigenitalium]VEU69598.1 50S ribosomal protein L18 [Mycoplasmopsis californica]